jgi:hypothetical protein
MHDQDRPSLPTENAETSGDKPRAQWQRPSVTELPKLTDLTLLTGAGIPGGGDPGGTSTVF